jgi:antitoxin Phd
MADGTWSMAEAKAKLSEVIDRALSEGPQHVTKHGKPAVVIVREDDWKGVSGKTVSNTLFDPAIRGLLTEEEVEALFSRDDDPGRPVDF